MKRNTWRGRRSSTRKKVKGTVRKKRKRIKKMDSVGKVIHYKKKKKKKESNKEREMDKEASKEE
jgi:hypothetical protein